MANAYLTKDNFKDLWEDSKTYMGPLQNPLSEYERIARNRPHTGINPAYPKNTDGTLAAIIQEFGKRIIQQIPTGQVVVKGSPIKEIVCNWVLTEEILPNANAQADVLQKSWGGVNKSLTFGSVYSSTFFGNMNDYFGSNFRLNYIKDIFLENGKLTFYDCNFAFIRAWYQESDIDAIIAKEQALIKEAKDRGEKYTPEWNIAELKAIKKEIAQKPTDTQSAGEKERNGRTEGIEIIHGFQNGVGAKFLSFAPSTEKFVKESPNKDPRGVMPIQVLYANIDFENPLGRGIVELSGGTQNVIDSMLQSYQYNRALFMAPPLVKRGEWNKSQAKLQPNAIIDLGTNPANTLEALKLDTTAIQNFGNDYGLFKSQIIALNNNGDTSVSAEVGNPGFSKTSAGVQAQQLKLGISDNYMRKQYERWFSDVCESMLNLHFANKSGVEELQLDKETANRIRKIDPTLVDANDVFVIDYDDYNDAIKFEVDASTSDKASKEAQLEALDNFWQRAESSPIITQLLAQYPDKAVEAYNQYLALTGVEDQEHLQIDVEQFQADQEAAALAQQQAMAQQPPIEGEVLPPELTAGQPDGSLAGLPLAEEPPIEGTEPLADGIINEEDFIGLEEDEVRFIQGLQERGIEDEIIAQGIVMLREGVPDEEVAQIISQAVSQEEVI